MPELPEVETIVRELDRKVTGKKLSRFFVYDKKIKKPPALLPAKVLGVTRRGKYIVFDLDRGKNCVIHLRMTGQLLFEDGRVARRAKEEEKKHERARFVFSDGSILRFLDVRRFGTVDWFGGAPSTRLGINRRAWFDGASHKRPKRGVLPFLGIEPLSRQLRARTMKELLHKSSRPIKNLLLDQKMIAGIGNIYADEALWLAGIHPKREAKGLSEREDSRLAKAIKRVLREAIKKGGITMRDYRRTGGEPGYYQHSRKVYDREGEKCLRCKTKIERMKLGGRSSYFCPKCQGR